MGNNYFSKCRNNCIFCLEACHGTAKKNPSFTELASWWSTAFKSLSLFKISETQSTTHVVKPSRFHQHHQGKKWDWIGILNFLWINLCNLLQLVKLTPHLNPFWNQFQNVSAATTAAPPSCELMVVHVAQASKFAWHAPELKQVTKTWHRNSQRVCLHMAILWYNME